VTSHKTACPAAFSLAVPQVGKTLMSAVPCRQRMKLTLEEKLAHEGQSVLRWMMDNILSELTRLATSSRTKKSPPRRSMVRWLRLWLWTGLFDIWAAYWSP